MAWIESGNYPALGIALVLIFGAVFFLGTGTPPAAPAENPNPPLFAKNFLVAPEFLGIAHYINAGPGFSMESLRGKVVLVDFWTYSCINCLRTLPYLKAWDEKYRSQGLVIIGVHSPEFAFEKDPANVEQAIRDLGIAYPVAMDNQYAIWNAYKNEYWPAHYLIDAQGRIRDQHFGEGKYQETEQMIRSLLKEAHAGVLAMGDELV